jgi:hypothetical protein
MDENRNVNFQFLKYFFSKLYQNLGSYETGNRYRKYGNEIGKKNRNSLDLFCPFPKSVFFQKKY